MSSSGGGVFLPGDPPPSTGQALTTPTITSATITGTTTISGATISGGTVTSTGSTLTSPTITAPVISGAATVASGATITTPTVLFTVSAVTATGATGGSGAVLPTVTPAFVTVTGATGSGVDLPTGPAGAMYLFTNLFAGTMRFYSVGGTINGTTGTTAFLLTTTGNKGVLAYNTTASGAWSFIGNT